VAGDMLGWGEWWCWDMGEGTAMPCCDKGDWGTMCGEGGTVFKGELWDMLCCTGMLWC